MLEPAEVLSADLDMIWYDIICYWITMDCVTILLAVALVKVWSIHRIPRTIHKKWYQPSIHVFFLLLLCSQHVKFQQLQPYQFSTVSLKKHHIFIYFPLNNPYQSYEMMVSTVSGPLKHPLRSRLGAREQKAVECRWDNLDAQGAGKIWENMGKSGSLNWFDHEKWWKPIGLNKPHMERKPGKHMIHMTGHSNI